MHKTESVDSLTDILNSLESEVILSDDSDEDCYSDYGTPRNESGTFSFDDDVLETRNEIYETSTPKTEVLKADFSSISRIEKGENLEGAIVSSLEKKLLEGEIEEINSIGTQEVQSDGCNEVSNDKFLNEEDKCDEINDQKINFGENDNVKETELLETKNLEVLSDDTRSNSELNNNLQSNISGEKLKIDGVTEDETVDGTYTPKNRCSFSKSELNEDDVITQFLDKSNPDVGPSNLILEQFRVHILPPFQISRHLFPPL